MNFIEEILETEKQSDNLLEKAKESASLDISREEEAKKRELASFSSQLKDKQKSDMEKQVKTLETDKVNMLQNLGKELEELKQKTSSKKKKAVEFVVSSILED